jgi:hypothetical protein
LIWALAGLAAAAIVAAPSKAARMNLVRMIWSP